MLSYRLGKRARPATPEPVLKYDHDPDLRYGIDSTAYEAYQRWSNKVRIGEGPGLVPHHPVIDYVHRQPNLNAIVLNVLDRWRRLLIRGYFFYLKVLTPPSIKFAIN